MKGPFNSVRPRRKPSINITPLIDVMFLLLIFFMVSSTFREHLGIDVTLPEAATAETRELGRDEVVINARGEYFYREESVTEEGLRERLVNLAQAEPQTTLMLRVDEVADFGRVVRVLDIVREIGGLQVILPTRPWQEP